MAGRSAVVVGVVVIALLSGCAADERPGAASEQAPVESSTPVPTVTPPASPDAPSTPHEQADAEITEEGYDNELAGPPVASYVSADTSALTIGPVGTTAAVSFNYFTSDVDQAIAALTRGFGFEPVIKGTGYLWGDFALYTAHLPGDYPELPRFYVWAEGSTVGSVPLLIGGKGQVGKPLSALSGDYIESGYSFVEAFPVHVDLALISDPVYGAIDPFNATMVWSSDGIVASWMTPERRY